MRKIIFKFKHWLNYSPPGALTARGWRLFKNEFQERAPIRFWLTNTGYHKYVLSPKWKYRRIHDWVRYRTYNKYHKVDTGLPPGYYEIDKKMLHVNFNMLKNFVENELAWHSYIWSEDAEKERSFVNRLSWHYPFYKRKKSFDSRKWATVYFEWAAGLDDPSLPPAHQSKQQAEMARETLALYTWWVDTVPNRKQHTLPEVSDQGLGDMSVLDEEFDREMEDFKKYEEVRNLNSKLREEWENEDDEMLARLVKIRRSLWT